MIETYYRHLQCLNCGQPQEVDIPKGVTVREFTGTATCTHCGCRELAEVADKPYAKHPQDWWMKDGGNNKFLCVKA